MLENREVSDGRMGQYTVGATRRRLGQNCIKHTLAQNAVIELENFNFFVAFSFLYNL